MPDFEVCVIGGGPAGFAAAMRCWDFGKRVALVEKGPLGGAGVFNGALSSKTFWELSRDYRNARRLNRGYRADNVEVDFDRVSAVVDQACSEKTRQIARQLEALAEPRPGCPGSIRHYRGAARFLDPHTIHVEGTGAGESRRISAENFIIATGSRPRELPHIAIDGDSIITSDHIGTLEAFPRSLVILGAGVVGCEFATIFANFGRTKVYLIDRAPRILPFEDADIANLCATNLEAAGVTIHHQANLISMEHIDDSHGGVVEYTIEHATGGRETIQVEKALISVGRVPNTESLDLDKAGVEQAERGHIIDHDTRTNVPHIYAVGDVTLDIALVNVGEIEGRHAAERICGLHDSKLSYDNLATIMFLAPEVAAIGLNEQTAQQRRIPYRVGVYDYSLVNRAIAMRNTEGFVKLLISDDEEMKILGMRALGTHASTTLEAVSLMIQHGRSARELAELYHPHPAITEGLQDCVRMLLGTSIYKPSVFQSELRLSRVHYDENEAAAAAAKDD
ncbi:Dihydrolipoyl dehydrogenase [Enhygromyxa salina]|uniref:Dihydrolipoyl dehydrogenase n=1 Tax=Enhygromyxa salina TaxID=215803 RepID=A0A2S9YCT2_9BACT|nr:NAD(P)/FAD-dependent oxidoreductase [Enhygromyxa salina]PRQ02811.1 Dihydrolipoyl dehydrogenase [Enhygromyxa salina]